MKLSVIVATRNRDHAIAGCLDSIATSLANASPLNAEIVVVDNGSEDDTSAIVNAWAGACPFPVRLVSEPKAGLSRAHNRALETARGELLAITDDDCRVSKEYVSQLLSYDASDGTELVFRGGRIELGDPSDLPLTIKTTPTRSRWNRRMNSARHENLGDCFAGCNMTMRRAVVEQLGPFDERFGPGSVVGSGGDVDYVLRAYLANITIEYVPDMTVFHYHGRKLQSVGHQFMQRYMIGSGGLYAKFIFKDPNLCRPVYWDIKNALKEILSGTNTFLPALGFSHRDKLSIMR